MKLRALIVDDDAVGREHLRLWLKDDPGVDLVGDCASGREAVKFIRENLPDLVFLDVNLPDLDGFEVLARLDAAQRPVIVFVTGDDGFAAKAFEVHALDFLVKPFERERFHESLRRAKAHVEQRQTGQLNQQLGALLRDLRPGKSYPDRLPIKSAGRVVLVKTSEIQWIEAADNYVRLHVGAEAHSLRQTMGELEAKLSPEKFLRVSRSAIVNLDYVKELQPMFHGEYVIVLKSGVQVTLTRGYRSRLEALGLV